MMMIPQNQQTRYKLLIIIGSIILISSYIIWYFFAYSLDKQGLEIPRKIHDINMYGRFIGLIIIFLGIVLNEKNRKLKYLIFIPITIFYIGLLLTYGINDILELIDIKLNAGGIIDDLLQGNKVVHSLILTTIICFILYLISLRQQK